MWQTRCAHILEAESMSKVTQDPSEKILLQGKRLWESGPLHWCSLRLQMPCIIRRVDAWTNWCIFEDVIGNVFKLCKDFVILLAQQSSDISKLGFHNRLLIQSIQLQSIHLTISHVAHLVEAWLASWLEERQLAPVKYLSRLPCCKPYATSS